MRFSLANEMLSLVEISDNEAYVKYGKMASTLVIKRK